MASRSEPVQLEALPPSAKTHPAPNLTPLELHGEYAPSPDGIDTNLLILFHGLGDSCTPFTKLGKSLNLPQTAILSIQAMSRIPLLDMEENAWQWWNSFDQTGSMIMNPNPIPTILKLYRLITYLTSPTTPIPSTGETPSTTKSEPGIGWEINNIHLFGFAQGGQVAAELALFHLDKTKSLEPSFGSLVTISAPLVSHPTSSPPARPSKPTPGVSSDNGRTPTLMLYRRGEERQMKAATYTKAFGDVKEIVLSAGGGMLRGRDEWQDVMKFWASRLKQRSALEFSEDVYRIKK